MQEYGIYRRTDGGERVTTTFTRCLRRTWGYGSISRRTGWGFWSVDYSVGRSERSLHGSVSFTLVSIWGLVKRGFYSSRVFSMKRFWTGSILKVLEKIGWWGLRSWGSMPGFWWFRWFWTGRKWWTCWLSSLKLLLMTVKLLFRYSSFS